MLTECNVLTYLYYIIKYIKKMHVIERMQYSNWMYYINNTMHGVQI